MWPWASQTPLTSASPFAKWDNNTYLPHTLSVVRMKKIMFAKCFVKTWSLSSKEGAQSSIIFVVTVGHVPTWLYFDGVLNCSRVESQQ